MMISELGQVVDCEYRIWCEMLKTVRLAVLACASFGIGAQAAILVET